jgi:PTS system ascorbate-specific IIA component
MTELILITYGQIGSEMLNAAMHIMNADTTKIQTISIYDEPDIAEHVASELEKALARFGHDTSYLIMTDLHGSTHFNVASRYLEESRIALVSGLNMPMLLRVLNHRDEDITTLLHFAEEGGVMGISGLNMTSIDSRGRV